MFDNASSTVLGSAVNSHSYESGLGEPLIPNTQLSGENVKIEQSIDNVSQFKQNFDAVFEQLKQDINVTLGNKIPLLDNVQNTLLTFMDDIETRINLELSVLTEINTTEIQGALFNTFHNLGILLDINQDGIIDIKDVKLNLVGNAYTFQTALGGDKTFNVSLLKDFGVSNLGLDLNGQAKVELQYEFNLGFGLELQPNESPKFYLDTSSERELSLGLTASLDNFNAQASFGLFTLDVTDKNPLPELTGTINIDLQDSNNQLTLGETPSIVATFEDGEASLKLGLSAKLNNKPVISADLNLDWTFDNPSFEQPVLGTVATQVVFNNQTYDSVQALINQLDYNVILSQGFEELLTLVKGQIISKLGNKIPLLGDISNQLIGFIDEIKNQIDLEFSNLTVGTVEAIQGALFNTFHNLGILLDTNQDGNIDINDLNLIPLPNNGYTFQAALGGDKTFNVSLLKDFGVSNLGLDLNGQAKVELQYEFNLGFGLELQPNESPKFYLDTSSKKELSMGLTASLDNFNAQASFGLFTLDVTDKNPLPELTGTINIDLQDSNNQLTLGETPSIVATFEDGEASLKLGLSAKLNNKPVISADLNLDWTFDNPSFEQPVLGTVATQVVFNNQAYDSFDKFVEQIDSGALLAQGFEELLNLLKEQIISKLGNKIPLLGDISNQLIGFIDEIKNQIDLEFSNLAVRTIDKVKDALFNTFHNLNILLDTNQDGIIDIKDVKLNLVGNTYTFQAALGGDETFGVDLLQDFGLPNLGLKLTSNGQASVGLHYEFDLGFGLELQPNESPKFYLDTSSDKELSLGLTANLQDFNAQASLGFLQLNVTDKNPLPELTGTIKIDLQDSNNQLTPEEIPSANLDVTFGGNVDLKLGLNTSIADAEFLPSLNTTFNLKWGFENANFNSSLANFGNTPQVSFDDFSIDLGTFFNKFALPVVKQIQDITKPIEPLIKFLTTPLKIGNFELKLKLGSISIGSTLLDLIEFSGQISHADRVRIESILNLIKAINDIPTDSNLSLTLGSFNIADLDIRTLQLSNLSRNQLLVADSSELLSQSNEKESIAQLSNIGLEFPIINDPFSALGLLLGKDVDLFKYHLPLHFSTNEIEILKFSIIIFTVGLNGQIDIGLDLNAGFDTTGLRQYWESGWKDPKDIFNGFYLDDNIVNGQDRPEVDLSLSLIPYAEAGINLGFVSAGVGIEGILGGHLFLDLKDPNNDGKLRGNELKDVFSGSPFDWFDVSGLVEAKVNAYTVARLKLGFRTIRWKRSYNIWSQVLLDYRPETISNTFPILAEDSQGELRLNIGVYAASRQLVDITDGDEIFSVTHKDGSGNNETLIINAFGYQQEYSGINKIIAKAGENNDTIQLDDTVLVSAFLSGGNGDDKLFGGSGNDTLSGDEGDDFLVGGAGADLLQGGPGIDSVSYEESTKSILINLATNETNGDATGDQFDSIEQFIGTDYADTLIDDSNGNTFFGGKGNDVLIGNQGEDFLNGDEGNDTISGGDDTDVIIGGLGNDSLNGDGGDDLIYGGFESKDYEKSLNQPYNDSLSGGDGNDSLYGGIGNDLLSGDTGNDILFGRSGNDTLFGNEDNDTLFGDQGNDSLNGGAGNDTATYETSPASVNVNLFLGTGIGGDAQGDQLTLIENLIGSDYKDTLVGDSQDNILEGRKGDDYLQAKEGNDTLIGNEGNDILFGGIGNDSLLGNEDNDTLSGNEGDDILSGGLGNDSLLGNEDNDTLSGNEGDDILSGGLGNDSLMGNEDNDTLSGNEGDDILSGGEGNDTATYATSSQSVNVNLFLGIGIGGDAQGDQLTLIENLIGSNYKDTLVGDSQDNILEGRKGDDYLQAAKGNDTLIGNEGNDILSGGLGNDSLLGNEDSDTLSGDAGSDSLDGGKGNDTAVYVTSPDSVNVNLFLGIGIGGDAQGDQLTLIENLIGSNYKDTLVGDSQDNILEGRKGDDYLQAKEGNDTLIGNEGNDILFGGIGNDSLLGNEDNDTLSGDAGNDILSGGLGNDSLLGNEDNDTLSGDAGNDILSGGSGNDFLLGNEDNDTLSGDVGNDVLSGGEGNDTATYATSSQSVNVNLFLGIGIGGDAEGDQLTLIENLIGSNYGDTLVGDSQDNILEGRKGDDYLQAAEGNDTLIGNEGNDILFGGIGNDSLLGNEGDDTLSGDAGNDILSGGSGNDSLLGNEDNDTLSGNEGDDILSGGLGNDSLMGNEDNDTLSGDAGEDILDGGEGNDTATYQTSPDSVNVNLFLGVGIGGDAQGDQLTLIENLIGSNYGDTLVGDSQDNILEGRKGDDYLQAAEGNDTLIGNEGNDILSGGLGNDSLMGNEDNDTLSGNEGDDILSGGLGNDSLMGNEDNDTLSGNEGDDILSGGLGNDSLMGNEDNDTLSGNEGDDILSGGLGNDSLMGNEDNDTLSGNEGDDILSGGLGNDSLMGNEDNDTLSGDAGEDILDGGEGNDTATYQTSPDSVNVNLFLGIGIGGDAQGDQLTLIENLIGSNYGDTLVGDSENNILDGGSGNDRLQSLEGNDTLFGDAGDDTLLGNTGNDILFGGSGNDSLLGNEDNDTLSGDAGNDILLGGLGDDLLMGNENNDSLYGESGLDTLIGGTGNDFIDGGDGNDQLYGGFDNDYLVGGTGDDSLYGEELNDTLIGNEGADYLDGGLGDDSLDGGDGNDTLNGGYGRDIIIGGNGDDILIGFDARDSILGGSGNDVIDGGNGNDILKGDEGNDTISGGTENDSILGGSGQDYLAGDQGNDILKGDEGNDTLSGGTGSDTLNGGDGNDTATYATSSDGVNVSLFSGIATGGDAQGDQLTLIENLIGSDYRDTLTGNLESNILEGGKGDDYLQGLAGNDLLIGGSGKDTLVGGDGLDQFIYTNSQDGGDTITDFEVGKDKIVLTQVFQRFNPSIDSYATAISQGYLQIGISLYPNAVLLFDEDGFSGSKRAKVLVDFENSTIDAIFSSNNFVM